MKDINLYLIRHGQTEWNIKDQMQGSQNSPLTEEGILGAKVTGKYLKDIPFIQAYSSTQQRAMETRDYIINENVNVIPTAELSDLCEMDFGIWEGKHVPTLKKAFPEFNTYLTDPANFDATVNQGENYQQVLARMERALKTIIENTKQDTGNILVVSHGTVLRILLCVLNGGDWRLHRDEAYFPRMLNTSISVVNYKQDENQPKGQFSVKFYNNVDHLANK
ncbi:MULTISPECIES: histidine phosphatase family protein [unclassified Gilliamella]|uniref:histidine phosphatase family protein n=1 Tax=unclassified Gilliamella TaxID=2685620 RepID=UPI00226AAC8D|nr:MULTISPECIES: histidine phosphatase family protein [unclassified Gilliamella]MCX8575324.1 histidine phosphatase family protein [Gilliamella sp. B3831]MCX8577644.1 histidine phosphatase family protein [Gilliamella sp. B3815]MCX8579606.1 histidine phosphatase family protein [Gilliamella sp. B2717]MCX8589057.1 histidine phosphatase family protein [Gilliamella sp. B3801]MCX8589739.1 histidine phosphatase family protein [Gilliamella sp. B3812]